MRARGHSLWIMPSGETYEELDKTIERVSAQYNSPKFKPHVTLLGEIILSEEKVLKRTHEIATHLTPFPLHLDEFCFEDSYFQCLFIKVRQSEAVMHAHTIAREVFQVQSEAHYVPHLSLLYGTIPLETKQATIASLPILKHNYFYARSIHVLNAEGSVQDWRIVGEIPLSDIKQRISCSHIPAE
ncbi:2'-5' RNA ligase family protein [Candidatus Pacearchaeota archaeon]|nr:2'-5' RNA ligase family protein [Candidatus Pacearchaeota archaeon]